MRRSLLLALVVLAGCLGPRPDPSAFFLLSPVAPSAGAAAVPVTLGVGPVTIPGYLDRPQIVVRVSDNELSLSEVDRWAEPLLENISRTLEENLARLLPGSSFVAYPWYSFEAPDFAVALDVGRFEADASGAVRLEAEWRLSGEEGVVDRGAVQIDEMAASPDRAATVAAQSRALAELSSTIADRVRRASGR